VYKKKITFEPFSNVPPKYARNVTFLAKLFSKNARTVTARRSSTRARMRQRLSQSFGISASIPFSVSRNVCQTLFDFVHVAQGSAKIKVHNDIFINGRNRTDERVVNSDGLFVVLFGIRSSVAARRRSRRRLRNSDFTIFVSINFLIFVSN